jgi:hypothetical protein
MENICEHLKVEGLPQIKSPTYEEAQQVVDVYIYCYNYERIQ